MFPNLLSLFLFSYWCAYGLELTRKILGGEITLNPHGSTKMKRNPCQSIKVGFRCHFIMHRLYMRPNDVILRVKSWRWVTLLLVLWEKKLYFHKLFNFRHIKYFFYLEFHFTVKTKLVKNCVSFPMTIFQFFFITIWYVNLTIV